MAEWAYAAVLKTVPFGFEGSSPSPDTNFIKLPLILTKIFVRMAERNTQQA